MATLLSIRIAQCYQPPLHRNSTYLLSSVQSWKDVQSGRRLSSQPSAWTEDDEETVHHDADAAVDDKPSASRHARSHNHVDTKPQPMIGRLVLVRHGQSEWNVTDPTRNLTARFVSATYQQFSLCRSRSVIVRCTYVSVSHCTLSFFVFVLYSPSHRIPSLFSTNIHNLPDWMGRHWTHSTRQSSSHCCWKSH